jgi:hypothetical protein
MIPDALISQIENEKDFLSSILYNSATDRLTLMGNIRNNREYADIRSLILLIRILPKTQSKLQDKLKDIHDHNEKNYILLSWAKYLASILKVKEILISNNIDISYTPKVIDPPSPPLTYVPQFTFSYPQLQSQSQSQSQSMTQKVSQD